MVATLEHLFPPTGRRTRLDPLAESLPLAEAQRSRPVSAELVPSMTEAIASFRALAVQRPLWALV